MHEAQTPDPLPVTPRASDLQTEQVTLALQQLRHTNDALQEMEQRLGDMTRDCAGILDRWARNDERHAAAVVELHARLSEWNDIERKLLSESTTRIHQFERSLQHEWHALRQKHEGPVQQLDEQARRIAETCVTAIDTAVKGFDRAEARLRAVEEQVTHEMTELAREVRDALGELRQGASLGPRQPWSLDNVVRLHNQLRAEADDTGDVMVAPAPLALAPDAGLPPEAPARAHGGDESAAAVATPSEKPTHPAPTLSAFADPPADPASGARRLPLVLLGATVALLVLAGVVVYRQIERQVQQASARAEAAEQSVLLTRDAAARQLAAVQRAANDRINSAEEAALSAQRAAAILASPDTLRLDLAPRTVAAGAAAHILWSRAHGVTVSASGLSPVAADRRYQVWLIAAGTAVPIGHLAPDASGRASFVAPPPPVLPRPVTGAVVTLEPADGSRQPTSAALLATIPRTPAPTP